MSRITLLLLLILCLPGALLAQEAEGATKPPGSMPLPGVSQAEDENRRPIAALALPDGSRVEFTGDGIRRTLAGREIWFAPEAEACEPLLFRTAGGDLRLWYTAINPSGIDQGWIRCLDTDSGRILWTHDFWYLKAAPASPVHSEPWIYCARGFWLERMDPETGVVTARFPARERITSLEAENDGSLRVHVVLMDPQETVPPLRFADGAFTPAIHSPSHLLMELDLFRTAGNIDPDFLGVAKFDSYDGYLDLHRFKTVPPPAGFEEIWSAYDLRAVEEKYRAALMQDQANPYLPLILAFCLHYQGRDAEAEAFFEKAYELSAVSWHEPLWMGKECEYLGLQRWADGLYEVGFRLYFLEMPAPMEFAYLLEVLIHAPFQRVGTALFANGYVDRTLYLIEKRRQIFPYTEGDDLFSRKFIKWYRAMGLETKAREEEAYLDDFNAGGDTLDPIPDWCQGVFGLFLAISLLAVILLIRNHKVWGAILAFLVTAFFFVATFGSNTVEIPPFHLVVGFAICVIVIPYYLFVRMRRDFAENGSSVSRLTRLLSLFGRTSYGYVLGAVLVMALTFVFVKGTWLTLFMLTLWSILQSLAGNWAGRRPDAADSSRAEVPGGGRYLNACLVTLTVLALFLNTLSVFWISKAASPFPGIDLGHPAWKGYLERTIDEADFVPEDLRFARALNLQLGGDAEGAEELYRAMPDDSRAVNNLGVLLMERDPEGALDLYRQSMALNPSLSAPRYNLGIRTGDEIRIQEARRLNPWLVDAFQRYCPDKAMIATLTQNDISKARALSSLDLITASHWNDLNVF